MRMVIQRVIEAKVEIEQVLYNQIGSGLLVLVAIEEADKDEDLEWMIKKLIQMRIFSDENNQMNYSVKDINGEILLISQFTLFASTKKGNRPGFTRAANPQKAKEMYHQLYDRLNLELPQKTKLGVFAADMNISLINQGPVTIILDSSNKE